MILRNVAGQKIPLGVLLTPEGDPITSSATVKIIKDDAGDGQASEGTLTHRTDGGWWYAPTQAETDAENISFSLDASGAVPKVVPVTTWPALLELSGDFTSTMKASIRTAIGLASANLDSQIATLSTLDGAGIRAALGISSASLETYLAGLSTQITGLNNLSALANLFGPPVLEIPDSGSKDYPFVLVVRDNEGKLVDLDDPPTISATNAAGTDRSANLSEVSHLSTGRYEFVYTVEDDAVGEGVILAGSGEVSEEGRFAPLVVSIVDYDSVALLAAIHAKTQNLPADPASQSGVESAITSATSPLATQTSVNGVPEAVRAEMDTNSTKLAAIVEDTGTTLPGAIPNAETIAGQVRTEIGTELATVTKLDTMLEPDGETGNSKFTAESVAEVGGGGGGECPNETTIANAVAAKITTDHGSGSYVRNTEPDNATITTIATNTTSILARLGNWTGTGINTVLGAFRGIWNKASGLTPSDLTSGVSAGDAGNNTTDSLPAIRDRGDGFWTGGGEGGYTPQQIRNVVWDNEDGLRTLNMTPQEAHDALKGGRITVTKHATLSVTIPSLGDLDARENLWFTAKASAVEGDDAALVQIEETAGLLRLEGAAAGTSGDGSLIVSDDESAAITVRLEVGATSLLQLRTGGVWDLKWRNESGQVRQLRSGRFDVVSAVTHAIN